MAALGLHSGEVDAEVSNDNVYVFGGNPHGLEGECQHFAADAGRACTLARFTTKLEEFTLTRLAWNTDFIETMKFVDVVGSGCTAPVLWRCSPRTLKLMS